MADPTYFGLHVRRIRRSDGFAGSLVIQRRNPMTLQWYDIQAYSEMDDYAYTLSKDFANYLADRLGRDGYGETMPHQPVAD